MQIAKLIFWIIFCQMPALAGGGAVSRGLNWYHGLVQPSFTPPDWLFGAAWGVLYILMGVAGFFLTRQGLRREIRPALLLFIGQLALNALWTPVFFGRQEVGWALLILTALIFITAWLLKQLWNVCRTAFWLLVPYIAWLGFAWSLNYAILLLN